MDLDLEFLNSLIAGGKGALDDAKEKEIDASFLSPANRKTFEFIESYTKEYLSFPTPEIIKTKTGHVFVEADSPFTFALDEILNRRLYSTLRSAVSDCLSDMEGKDPNKALDRMDKAMRKIRTSSLSKVAKPETLDTLSKRVMDQYYRIKNGETGILTPWATVNSSTLGFWPQDLILIAARPAVGKSHILVILAEHFWRTGKRVLFVSTEMSKDRITQRFMSVHFKIPLTNFYHGRLGEFIEKNLEENIKKLQGGDRFHVAGGDFNVSVKNIDIAIDHAKPDVLIIDGAYLIKGDGKTRVEQAANTFDELKRIANRNKIPTIVTHQLNREAKGGDKNTADLANLALTDVTGWNADMVFFLHQTPEMRADNRMTIKGLKTREGLNTETLIRWDFNLMNFSEIDVVRDGGGGGDADELDTGFEPTGADDDLPF